MRFPLLSKAATLAALMVLLLLALWRVEGLVGERQQRQRETEAGVAESLAGDQTMLGPVIQRRCEETWTHEANQGNERHDVQERHAVPVMAWPQRMETNVGLQIEPRYRSLFKVNSYLAKTTMQATWDSVPLPAPAPAHEGGRVSCEATPTLAIALSDARGIRAANVTVGGRSMKVLPGSGLDAQPNGFHIDLPDAAFTGPIQLQLSLDLAGTEQLSWVPVGQETKVHVTSNWPHPSFGGRFLPVDRRVTSEGFESQWQVSALATSAQRATAAGLGTCPWREESAATAANAGCTESFGVSFIDPVNRYVLSDRAVKYGLLFIALTFVAVALVEALRRLRVHPIQYLLVGCALTVFFLLLLSLSEHLPFAVAYGCGAAACTALLTFYGAHVLGGVRPGIAFGAGIGVLYGALYAVLQMEQAALVLGSLLLFAVLAAVMIATRRIDWYALAAQLRDEARTAAAKPV